MSISFVNIYRTISTSKWSSFSNQELIIILLPNPIDQVGIVVEQKASIVITIDIDHVLHAIGYLHLAQLLDLRHSLFRIESSKVNISKLLAIPTIQGSIDRVLTQLIIETLSHVHRVLLLLLIHDLNVDTVVMLESSLFYFVLPDFVVELHVVEKGVD